MKKSLLALAAAGAFAGAAQAQSSVTVYGILDVGYTGASEKVTSGAGVVSNQNVSRISNSMESGSRIGFRGTEDLGGGTAANFVFELGIQPAGNGGSNPAGTAGTGTTQTIAQGSYNGQGSTVWNPNVRQAFVGLSQKGMGLFRIGTQNTLFWEQAGSNTAGELVQTFGSMLAPTTSGAFFTNSGTSSLSTAVQNNQSVGAYTERTTNTINLRTERMAGVMLKASYTLSNQSTLRTNNTGSNLGYTGGVSNQGGWQAALDWNIAKANIQASYAAFKSDGPFTATAAQLTTATFTTNSPSGWGNGLQGTNVNDTQALITASYNFGILKAYAGWTNRKIESLENTNVFLKRTAQEIGARGYITKTIEGWASAGNGRFSAFGIGQPTANITGYQAGANYWMSKRTNLYAIYGQNQTSSTTNGSYNVNQYSLGIRHTF